MKKLISIFLLLMLLSACGTYRTITVSRLKLGMSKADVEYMFGPPKRILSVSQSEYGYQEVLEYKTNNGEIYALDFMNDQLVGYEFLYDDIDYIPPMPQPVVIVPGYYPGRPIERPPRPRPPARPVPPARPNPDNVTPSRPPSTRPTPSRPETGNTTSDRSRQPVNGSTATRQPVSGTNAGAERPSQPQQESSRQPRTESTGSNSDNQRTSTSPANNSSGSGRR